MNIVNQQLSNKLTTNSERKIGLENLRTYLKTSPDFEENNEELYESDFTDIITLIDNKLEVIKKDNVLLLKALDNNNKLHEKQ